MMAGGTGINRRLTMKKLITSILFCLPIFAIASEPSNSNDKGLKILPMNQMNLPQPIKDNFYSNQHDIARRGYTVSNNQTAEFLLTINNHAAQEIQQYKSLTDNPYDTHLKSNYSEIKLSFPFSGLKDIDHKDIIGYAALGSYGNGWDGLRIFFNSNIGVCSYSRMSVQAMYMTEESTEYLVNKNPTEKSIDGNEKTGLLYSVSWYKDSTLYILECANYKFDPKIMPSLIDLANKIDRN